MQKDQTEANLVLCAQAGNSEAFARLVEHYQPLLHALAYRSVEREEIARELVQEALLQAYLSLDQLRDITCFKYWLCGIVINLCHNWARQAKGRTALTLPIDQETFLAHDDNSYTSDPQDLIVEQELYARVRNGIDLLSPKNRIALALFYYEELSLLEIAQQLNISLADVKSRIHKGRDQVRTYLQTFYPELATMPLPKENLIPMITVNIAKVLAPENIYPRRTILVLQDEQQQRAVSLWFSDNQTHQAGLLSTVTIDQTRGLPTEPLTTDFLSHILDASGCYIEKIEINVLQGKILYAHVLIRAKDTLQSIRARLSDALPLAIRSNCPLAVSEEIFNTMGLQLTKWGQAQEQQIDAVVDLAVKTPTIGKIQGTLHSPVPRNLNFADGLAGWRTRSRPDEPNIQLDTQTIFGNKNSLRIMLLKEIWQRATLTHEGFLADHYRGQRVRMSTYVRAETVHRAFFEASVTTVMAQPSGERTTGTVAETQHRPFCGTHDWKRYELVFDVPLDATFILLHFELQIHGTVWINGFELECVDKTIPVTGATIKPHPLQPANLDFTQGLENWRLAGSFAQDYSNGMVESENGISSAYLKADKQKARGSAYLLQTIQAQNYQNQRLRFSAKIKSVGVIQQAGIYICAGSGDERELNMTSLQGTTDWAQQELIFDIPMCLSIEFGVILHGEGQIWLQNLDLEIIEA